MKVFINENIVFFYFMDYVPEVTTKRGKRCFQYKKLHRFAQRRSHKHFTYVFPLRNVDFCVNDRY